MKKSYIKPYTEVISVQTESLLQAFFDSGVKRFITVNDRLNYGNDELDFTIDNEEKNDGWNFSKPSDPNLWDDEEW